MKKILLYILLIIITVLFGLTACYNGNNGGNVNGSETGGQENGGSGETDNPPLTEASNILIVYFSCTNTAESIAKHIQTETKGTLYEIVPETPYTADDLKYYTDCRADREQADPNARPAINGKVGNMENYKVVFLGYPIWHGEAPRIISTFLESYDFTNKTIVPFCTSASSGIGSSDTNLHALAAHANWASGRRFASGTSQSTVADWIESLDIKLAPDGQLQEKITKMYITLNGNKLEVTLEKNSSADALVEILKENDITYTANDYGGFEKVGDIGYTLPQNNTQITTEAGDVILYQGRSICLYYDTNSWNFTRIGKINGYTAEELRSLLYAGKGSVQVTLSLAARNVNFMTDGNKAIEQNLIDAGCDKDFIKSFMNLTEAQQTAEMLKMLAVHRKNLLDGIHADERKIYCLDYLVNKLKNN